MEICRTCNTNNVYRETLDKCIKKAWRFIIKSKNMTVNQQQEFIRKIMSVDLDWFHIMEQLKHRLHLKQIYDNGGLRIYQLLTRKNNEVSLVTKEDNLVSQLDGLQQKDTDPQHSTLKTQLHKLKIILYYMTARETQHIKLFNILDKERRLIMTELNTTLLDRNDILKRLQEAVEINKSLENEANVMRNAVEAVNSQLLGAKEAARFGEEVKALFDIAQDENKALKEEMKRKDSEMLKLKECVASTEEISRQLRQQLNNNKDEMHQHNQLLDTAISENDKICNERNQLVTENDHLKREIDQLKEKCDQQSKLISEQKNDSGKEQEKTTAEGSDNDDGPSGYPKDIFTEEVDDKYLCTKCRQILKNPIQSFCGHRFCKDCFDHLVREGGDRAICHRCSEECEDAEENTLEQFKTFPDNAIRRELNSMRANCDFANCKWSGSFKEYEEHFEKCDWCPRRCDTCGKKIPKNQFDEHNCKTSTLVGGQQCKYQCGKPVSELDFALHLKQLLPEHFEALFRRLENVTSFIGTYSVPSDRQGTLCDWITTIENLIKSVQDKKQREGSTAKGTNFSVRKNPLNERGTEESARATSGSFEEATGGAAGGAVGGSSVALAQTPQANDAVQKLAKLSADIKTCENLLISLDREVEHDFRITETLQTKEATLKLNMESLNQSLKSIDRVMSLKNASLADLDKRVGDLEQTSYDGSLLWQLTDFQRRRQEAILGRTTSIYSPPFYTSKTGYKMCARLYLNGDGMGRGSHVSLFFVIMRGQYDALLKWPFRQKVTLMFLDQSGKEQHVMDAFRPDPTSSSFKRPTTEMNIASGCPLFMSLMQLDSPLHSFVKDDTAFIKIVIGREDI